MLQVKDLNLEEEILPLFDYSQNPYAKDKIRELLHTPLGSIREIIDRQALLTSFRKNQSILKDYSYNFLYFREVHQFTISIKPKDLPDNIIRYRLFTPGQLKSAIAAALYNSYFCSIVWNSTIFPGSILTCSLKISSGSCTASERF